MRTLFLFILSFHFVIFLNAQPDKIRFGKIDKADLDLLIYEPDPTANALILADHGAIKMDFGQTNISIVFHHLKRIKVLTNAGKKTGDISIPFSAKDEKIEGLKAHVIQSDGTKIAVKKSDFFTEKINDYRSQIKFTMPALQVGSILEYEYRKRSTNLFTLQDWYFQSEYPVRESFLTTNIPVWYEYITLIQGRKAEYSKNIVGGTLQIPQIINESTGVAEPFSKMLTQRADFELSKYWMTNVPKLSPEPFITTMRDYYGHIMFQLRQIQYPNKAPKLILNDWETVAKELRKDKNFGLQWNDLSTHIDLLTLAKKTIDPEATDLEKLNSIIALINEHVQWDGYVSLYSRKTLDDCLRNGLATAGELNIIAIALCKHYDIEINPLLVSTRQHGQHYPKYPFLDQFNLTLGLAEIDNKLITVDVSSWATFPQSLRSEFQNYYAWKVTKDSCNWINLPRPSSSQRTLAEVNYQADGTYSLAGKFQLKGNYIYKLKEKCANVKCDEVYKNHFISNIDNAAIQSLELDEATLPKDLKVNITAAGNAGFKEGDEFLYLDLPVKLLAENPLKLKTRAFAVDIPSEINETIVNVLNFPKGYVLEEAPIPIKLVIPKGGASFSYNINAQENKLQIISTLKIDRLKYSTLEYEIIRGFFEQMYAKLTEPVVLKKA